MAVALAPDAHTIEVGAHEGAVLRELVRPRSRKGAISPSRPSRSSAPNLERDFRELPGVEIRGAALADENGPVQASSTS